MKKLFAIILTIVMVCGMFAACAPAAGSDYEYISNKGKMVVGITDYAPMDYKDDNGEWIGFDADLARMVAAEMNLEVEFFVIADWGKRFVELDTKQIDVIWNGMTISQDVLNNCNCSDPYVLNAQVVVMKADKLADYPDVASMKDLSVAVESGSAGYDAAVAAGFTNIVPVQYQDTALMEVGAGTADACVIDITMAMNMTGEGTNYADLALGENLTEETYGIGFRKGSDMTAKINELLKKFKEDGSMRELADKYGVTLAD